MSSAQGIESIQFRFILGTYHIVPSFGIQRFDSALLDISDIVNVQTIHTYFCDFRVPNPAFCIKLLELHPTLV